MLYVYIYLYIYMCSCMNSYCLLVVQTVDVRWFKCLLIAVYIVHIRRILLGTYRTYCTYCTYVHMYVHKYVYTWETQQTNKPKRISISPYIHIYTLGGGRGDEMLSTINYQKYEEKSKRRKPQRTKSELCFAIYRFGCVPTIGKYPRVDTHMMVIGFRKITRHLACFWTWGYISQKWKPRLEG